MTNKQTLKEKLTQLGRSENTLKRLETLEPVDYLNVVIQYMPKQSFTNPCVIQFDENLDLIKRVLQTEIKELTLETDRLINQIALENSKQ